jgi:FkbM family methyltransferase
MFNELLRDLYFVKIAKYNKGRKLIILATLLRFSFKRIFFKKRNKEICERFFGYKVLGLDYSSLDFLYKELFCSGDYFFKTPSKSPVIIDCGANIGMATLYFKKLFPTAKIIAFEANPHVYQILKKNMENNNLFDVEINNVALYDEEKEVSFFTADQSGNLRGSIRQERGGKNKITVQAKKLSNYIRQINRIDLIKIDVEGAEVNIINDLFNSSLLHKADQYIIEYHHNMDRDKSCLSEFLLKFEMSGFSYSIKANFYRVSRFQEILLYFYKNPLL